MDKILAILNIVLFGFLFTQAFNVVFVKKHMDVKMEVSKSTLTIIFILFCLPVELGLSIVF